MTILSFLQKTDINNKRGSFIHAYRFYPSYYILSYVYRALYTVCTGTYRPTNTSHTMIPHHPVRGLLVPQMLPVAQHLPTPVLRVDTIQVVTRTWARTALSVSPAAPVVSRHHTPVLRVDNDLVVTRTWARTALSVFPAAPVVSRHPTPVLRVDYDLVVARTWARTALSVFPAAPGKRAQ